MKKGLFALTACVISCMVYAQEGVFNKEDLMAAFKQYNPLALEKATSDAQYQKILEILFSAYSLPRTEQNRYETIALVKNFDNSIYLKNLQDFYFEKQTLAQATGVSLQGLNDDMLRQLRPVSKSIFQNTLDVRQLQLKEYKQQLKALKQQKDLSAEEKQSQIQALQNKIKAVKQEIKRLKSHANHKVKDVSEIYLAEMQSKFSKEQSLRALESQARDVKANHKKPVAQ